MKMGKKWTKIRKFGPGHIISGSVNAGMTEFITVIPYAVRHMVMWPGEGGALGISVEGLEWHEGSGRLRPSPGF